VTKNAVDIVIQSLKHLPDNIHFLILGIGPDEAVLKKLAQDEGVSARVQFLGQVDHKEMPKYLKVSDIFIRPSRSEGMGNSFVEAMAARIPVVATAVGGITDFLFDPTTNPDKSPTGLFAKVADPEDTARAIKQFIDDKTLTEQCVDNAYTMVMERYDWDIIARDMRTRVFDRMLA
jgi:glycosyltransferase involved in cell wall biosynthesis